MSFKNAFHKSQKKAENKMYRKKRSQKNDCQEKKMMTISEIIFLCCDSFLSLIFYPSILQKKFKKDLTQKMKNKEGRRDEGKREKKIRGKLKLRCSSFFLPSVFRSK